MQDAPPAKLEASAAIERDAKKARQLFAKPNRTLPDDIRELGRWTPERGDALYKDLVENLPSMDLVRALLERDREVHPNMQAYVEQAKHTVAELERLKAAGGDGERKFLVVFLAASGCDGAEQLREELERSPTLSVDDVRVLCSDIMPDQDLSSNYAVDGLDGHGRTSYAAGIADVAIVQSAFFNSELSDKTVGDLMRVVRHGGVVLLWSHDKLLQNVTPWIWAQLNCGGLCLEDVRVLGSDAPDDLAHAYNFDFQLRRTSEVAAGGELPPLSGAGLMRSVIGLGGAGAKAAADAAGTGSDIGGRIAKLKELLGGQLKLWLAYEALRGGHVNDQRSLVAFLSLIATGALLLESCFQHLLGDEANRLRLHGLARQHDTTVLLVLLAEGLPERADGTALLLEMGQSQLEQRSADLAHAGNSKTAALAALECQADLVGLLKAAGAPKKMDENVRAGVYVTIPGNKAEPLPKVGEGGSGVANRVDLQKPIPHSSAIMVVMPESLTKSGPKSTVITAEDVLRSLTRGAAESLVLLALGGASAFDGNRMAGSPHTDPVAAGT
jgi:hypothetical protein